MSPLLIGLLIVIPPLALSLVGTALMRRWAPRLGLVDRPGERKVHVKVTALGGGVAIYLATVLPVAAGYLAAVVLAGSPPAWLPEFVAAHLDGIVATGPRLGLIGLTATAVMIVGLCDDRWNLNFLIRLVIQLALATVLVVSGIRITGFIDNPVVTGVLTVLWIVGLTNAFNFLDNMDALSAGVAAIASVLLLVVQLTLGHWFVAVLLLVLVGALAGFLVHNWPPARIFMGDAGSNFVGFLLGTVTVLATFFEQGGSSFSILAPFCVMAVPIYDSASVILIRLREGRNPFHPDKRHFSHRLVDLGLSSTGAVLTIYLVTLASGAGALLLYHVNLAGAVVIVAQVLAMLAVVAILEAAGSKGAANGSPKEQADTPET